MPLIIKTEDGVRSPHLAVTHAQLQSGAANGRNVSLLMKSDIEITEDIANLIHKVTGEKVEVNKASYATLWKELEKEVKNKFSIGDYHYTWVIDFDENFVIFSNDLGLHYVDYRVEGDNVVLGDEAKSVTEVVRYKDDGGTTIVAQKLGELEDDVQRLIIKSFENISNNEKLKDILKSVRKGEIMEQEIQKAVEDATKHLQEQLTKANNDLQEALNTIESLTKDAQEQKDKVRKDKLSNVIKDAEKLEEVFKATASLDEAGFEVILSTLVEKAEQVENSDLFSRQSVNDSTNGTDEEPMHIKMLKAKYQPNV